MGASAVPYPLVFASHSIHSSVPEPLGSAAKATPWPKPLRCMYEM